MEFDFRTESKNGLVLFVRGRPGIHFLIQFVNGGLWFEISSVQHRAVLMYPAESVSLCDGTWRHVSFRKQGQYMEATVTGGPTVETGSSRMSLILYVHSHTYFGGIAPGSNAENYIRDNNLDYVQGSEYDSFTLKRFSNRDMIVYIG